MVFSDENKILVTNLYQLKGYKAMKLVNEFSNKWWTKISINRLLIKFEDAGAENRLTGSGRPRSTHTEENVDLVNDLIVSQENTLQTHRTVREILVISWDVTTMSLVVVFYWNTA